MKKGILTGLVVLLVQFVNAQINAITDTGDEVILYESGTWVYANDSIVDVKEIALNTEEFKKDKKSTFLVKSNNVNVGLWINPKKWKFTKGTDNDSFEFQFQKKGSDLYALLISEKMQIPLETLKGIAINNARGAAPDVRVVKEEYRIVNGTKVLMMQLSGTIQGMKFTYYGYYFSNDNGTIQLLTYTGEKLFKGYQDDVELFLNGFIENKV